MAYFWVNQGSSYVQEREAGILWAPEFTTTGGKLSYWDSMLAVAPGDVIFNYADLQLKGYSVATSTASQLQRPYQAGANYSAAQGGRVVFCTYTTINPAITFAQLAATPGLIALLQAPPNPVVAVNSRVAMKYLCPISTAAGIALQALVGGPPTVTPPPKTITTVMQLKAARYGQGQFRNGLLAHGACAVTGLTNTDFLIASHIKPWAKSTDAEKLDPNNGLLLAAGVDSAFDGGYIGFDAGWKLIAKASIGPAERVALGIPLADITLPATLHNATRAGFLQWHRKHFRIPT